MNVTPRSDLEPSPDPEILIVSIRTRWGRCKPPLVRAVEDLIRSTLAKRRATNSQSPRCGQDSIEHDVAMEDDLERFQIWTGAKVVRNIGRGESPRKAYRRQMQKSNDEVLEEQRRWVEEMMREEKR